MKLHLPRVLFAAVVAAAYATQTAFGLTGWVPGDAHGAAYFIDTENAVTIDATPWTKTTYKISPDAANLSQILIDSFTVKSGDTVNVGVNGWSASYSADVYKINSLVLESGAATLNFTNCTSIDIADSSGAGTVTISKEDNDSINLNGSLSYEMAKLKLSGSTSAVITSNFTVTGTSNNRESGIYQGGGNGSITFGNGTDAAVASVQRIEIGDVSGSATSELNVKANYTLKVTGSNTTAAGGGTGILQTDSLVIGSWNAASTVNIEGQLLAENAGFGVGISGGTLNIKDGGVVAVKGIYRVNGNSSLALNMEGGSKLILGSLGINSGIAASRFSSDLQGGTIASYAESTSILQALNINGDVTIDTNRYVFAEDGNSISAGSESSKIALSGNLSGTGSITTAGSGTLQLGAITANIDINDAVGALCLAGTLTMGDSNTLTLGSTISVVTTDITQFTSAGSTTYVDASGAVSDHGFAQGTYTLVTGGTIDGSASLTVGSSTTTIDNANRTFTLAGADSRAVYYTSSTVTDSLSAIQTAAEGALQSVNVKGGTLNVDAALTTGQSIDVYADSTLAIAEGTVLEKSSVNIHSGAVTLAGAGEYVAGSMTPGATLGSDWTGIVSISGNKDAIYLDSSSYGNNNSKVRLNGLSGWVAMGAAQTTARELLIGTDEKDSAGFKITAMSENKTYKFTGKISGSGVFEVADSNNASGDTVEFSGDISGWTGTVKKSLAGSNAKTVKFSGDATTVNVDVETAAGTANVVFDNASAVTMNGTISGTGTTNLTTSGTGTKTFEGDVTVNNASLTGGKSSFANLTVGGTLTLSGTENLDVEGKLALNGATLNLTALSVTATAGEQVFKLANVGTLESGAVTVTGLDALGDRKWSLQNANGTVVLASGGSVGEFSGVSAASLDDSLQLVVAGYTGPVELTATAVANLTGATLTIGVDATALDSLSGDLAVAVGTTAWNAIVDAVDGNVGATVSVVLQGTDNSTLNLTGYAGAVTLNGYSGTGTAGEYFVAYIPEPATATLSLLALAALAARRRRK